METEEIFKQIIAQPKWYAGIPMRNGFHNAQSANRIKKRFFSGTLSEKKIAEIFRHFNYEKTTTIWTLKQAS